jgi:cobalt-zinc-cadmium efflux system membrane fusion protein
MNNETDEIGSENSSEASQGALAGNKGQLILVVVLLAVAGVIVAAVLMRGSQATGASNSEHKEAAGEKHGDGHAGEDEHAEGGDHAEGGVITLDEEAEEEIGIELETAQLRSTTGTFQITGIVGPNQTRQAHIRPLSRGRVEKVYIRTGDRVRAGQPLVSYDNIELGELISEYETAKANLEKANAGAEVSKRSVERAQKLTELGAVTGAELEKRDAEYKSSVASINVQRAQAAMIEQKMRRFGLTDADFQILEGGANKRSSGVLHTVLRSPFDGVIIKAEVAESEVVYSERELFTVANLSTVWVQGVALFANCE